MEWSKWGKFFALVNSANLSIESVLKLQRKLTNIIFYITFYAELKNDRREVGLVSMYFCNMFSMRHSIITLEPT